MVLCQKQFVLQRQLKCWLRMEKDRLAYMPCASTHHHSVQHTNMLCAEVWVCSGPIRNFHVKCRGRLLISNDQQPSQKTVVVSHVIMNDSVAQPSPSYVKKSINIHGLRTLRRSGVSFQIKVAHKNRQTCATSSRENTTAVVRINIEISIPTWIIVLFWNVVLHQDTRGRCNRHFLCLIQDNFAQS